MSEPESRLRHIYSLLAEISRDGEYAMRAYITEQCAAERERCEKIADAEPGVAVSGELMAACECGQRIAAKIRSGE